MISDRARAWRLGWGGLSALGLALALPACGGNAGQLPVYPVKGQVALNGEPTDGAFLVFHPVAGEATKGDKTTGEPLRPRAQVKSDGSFELTTYQAQDGAPAGEYAVTVEWRKLIQNGKDASPGPNVIPSQYSQATSTPIKITVNTSPNAIDPIKIEAKTKTTRRR